MDLQIIKKKIHELSGQKIILDFDLAKLYNVEPKRLKQAVKRNMNRFPDDFMFEITEEEYIILRSQNVSSSSGWGGRRYMPYAFTEQGVAMLSSVLKSKTAIEVNIFIMRAFVLTRQYLTEHKKLKKQISKIEKQMNKKFKNIFEALNYLLQKDKQSSQQKERNQIGFK